MMEQRICKLYWLLHVFFAGVVYTNTVDRNIFLLTWMLMFWSGDRRYRKLSPLSVYHVVMISMMRMMIIIVIRKLLGLQVSSFIILPDGDRINLPTLNTLALYRPESQHKRKIKFFYFIRSHMKGQMLLHLVSDGTHTINPSAASPVSPAPA